MNLSDLPPGLMLLSGQPLMNKGRELPQTKVLLFYSICLILKVVWLTLNTPDWLTLSQVAVDVPYDVSQCIKIARLLYCKLRKTM